MKSLFITLTLALTLAATQSYGQSRTLNGTTEIQHLGMAAGAALACDVQEELKNFELIASRIIANKAPTKKQEIKDLKVYAAEKLRAYRLQKNTAPISCREVVRDFKNQRIFQSTVYADGSVKLPDGVLLRARKK